MLNADLLGAAMGMNFSLMRWIAVYLQVAGFCLFLYKLYVAYLTLKRASSLTETADLLRAAMALAVILVLPYGTGAWLVDTLAEKTRWRNPAAVTLAFIVLIFAWYGFFFSGFATKIDFAVPSF